MRKALPKFYQEMISMGKFSSRQTYLTLNDIFLKFSAHIHRWEIFIMSCMDSRIIYLKEKDDYIVDYSPKCENFMPCGK